MKTTAPTLLTAARRQTSRCVLRFRRLQRRWLLLTVFTVTAFPMTVGAQQAPVDDSTANEALNAGVVVPPGPVVAPFSEPGRPSQCRLPDQSPGTWAAITGPEFLTYSAGSYTDFDTDVPGDSPWNLTIDPFTPCRWYRIGYDTDGRTNPRRLRNVIERSTETSNGVRKWEPVFTGADHGLGSFAARGIVIPSSRRIFVIEDGAGVGVLRGDLNGEGRITWSAANGRTAGQQGMSGQKVVQLVFAPGSDQIAYAATRPCDSIGPYCAGSGTSTYQLWSTVDSGDHWTVIGAWQPFGYAGVRLAVDPAATGSGNGRLVVQYTRSSLTGLLGAVPPAWGVAACSGPPEDGSRWACVAKYDVAINGSSYQQARGLYATRSPATGGTRLWLEYAPAVGGISNWNYSDDGGVTWPKVPTVAGVAPVARQRPTPDGDLPMVGVMLSGGGFYTESATYRWRGPGEKELELLPEPEGLLPSYYPDNSKVPAVGTVVTTADGGMIVPHVMHCGDLYRCPGLDPDRQSGQSPMPYRVQLLRYAPDPSRVPDRRAMPLSEGPPSSLTSLSDRGSCADDPPGAHVSSVVYVGDELLVSRGDPAPPDKPYTAVLHRYRPRSEGTTFTCEPAGTIEITFPPNVYDAVRDATPNPRLQKPWGVDQPNVLPADHPRIGDMAFDPATGRLWFFLRAMASPTGQYKATRGNRTGLWTVALPPRDPGVRTLRAQARHEHDRLFYCTYGNEWPEGGTSSELLTLDPVRKAVWGCPVGRAAPVSMTTGERLEHPCRFDAPFRGDAFDGADSNWLIDDLQFVDRDRVLMSNNRYVYLVDLANCGRKPKTFGWPSSVSPGTVTPFLTTSMTCDALTFAERYDSGDGHQLAPGTTALWVPLVPATANGQLPRTPWALAWPDKDTLCPWDTALSVPPAETTEGEDAVVTAKLLQVSNGAPAWGQRVSLTLAGKALGVAVTDRAGVAKVVVPAKDVPKLPEAGVAATFEITARFAGTAAYRPAGPALGSLLVRPLRPLIRPTPPPEAVVIPTLAPAPAPVVALPPFAPAILPQPAAPPPASNVPQTQAQPIQASAQEKQKQFEGQLAVQESTRSDETAEEEGYAMSAIDSHRSDGAAGAAMATAFGMLVGFGVWIRAQVSPSRQRARARRRR